jgi:hypothetical protein
MPMPLARAVIDGNTGRRGQFAFAIIHIVA